MCLNQDEQREKEANLERGEDKTKREGSHLVPMDSESSPRDFPLSVWRVRDGSGTEKNQKEKQGERERELAYKSNPGGQSGRATDKLP